MTSRLRIAKWIHDHVFTQDKYGYSVMHVKDTSIVKLINEACDELGVAVYNVLKPEIRSPRVLSLLAEDAVCIFLDNTDLKLRLVDRHPPLAWIGGSIDLGGYFGRVDLVELDYSLMQQRIQNLLLQYLQGIENETIEEWVQ